MEKRQFKRIEVKIPCVITIDNNSHLTANIINIGEAGLAFLSSQMLSLNTNIKIKLLGNYSHYDPILTEVIWYQKSLQNLYVYGAKFTNITDNNVSLLNKIFADYNLEVIIEKKEIKKIKLEKLEKFPSRITKLDYEEDIVKKRIEWLSKKCNVELKYISEFGSIKPQELKKNIENLIGLSKLPIGITGPLKINGEYAKGFFYVPFATTQGTLTESYHRGMLVATASGGVNVLINKNKVDITPVFVLRDIFAAKNFVSWVKENFLNIKKEAEKTTNHGKLIEINPYWTDKKVFLNFCFTTGDAMGLNIINIATDAACRYIYEINKNIIERWYLRSNLSSDKKPSYFNLITGYGKSCIAEIVIPRNLLYKFLKVYPEEMVEYRNRCIHGTLIGGMMGLNAHCANGLAAIFIACGQDVAQIVNASCSVLFYELTKDNDLYASLTCPSMIVGTVGGGTYLPTQRECLEILGCYGDNKVEKFAEIITAVLLCGELSLTASIISNIHAEVDIKLRQRDN